MHALTKTLIGTVGGLALAGSLVLPASAHTNSVSDAKNDVKKVGVSLSKGSVSITSAHDPRVDIREVSVTNTKDAVTVDIRVEDLKPAAIDTALVEVRTGERKKANYIVSVDPAHPHRASIVSGTGKKAKVVLAKKGIAVTTSGDTLEIRIGADHLGNPGIVSVVAALSHASGARSAHEDATGAISKRAVNSPKTSDNHWTPRTRRG
jgi:hypothetical protein